MGKGHSQGGNSGMSALVLQSLGRLEKQLDSLERDRVIVRPCQQCRNGYKFDPDLKKFARDADENLVTCEICNGRGEHVYRVNELPRQVLGVPDESAIHIDEQPSEHDSDGDGGNDDES